MQPMPSRLLRRPPRRVVRVRRELALQPLPRRGLGLPWGVRTRYG